MGITHPSDALSYQRNNLVRTVGRKTTHRTCQNKPILTSKLDKTLVRYRSTRELVMQYVFPILFGLDRLDLTAYNVRLIFLVNNNHQKRS